MKKNGNPSIKDVATVAGVSFKTVSRVLNADPGVSEELRQRVLKAVKEVGYVANAGARAMRSGKSDVVGFISDVITTTPYSYEIVKGVQDALSSRGLSMLIANTEYDTKREAKQIAMFLENRVRGIIYASMFHRPVDMPTIPDDVDVVMVNCFDAAGRYPAVVPDDEQIGYSAAQYLIGMGHRRIAYLTLHKKLIATPLRARGFMTAVREAKLPLSGVTVKTSRRLLRDGNEMSMAREIIEELFSAAHSPTAILAANDPEAMPIVSTLQRLGLSIPGDVSVLGIDDYRLICERIDPPLSSIALPYYEMGKRGVERLFGNTSNSLQLEKIPGPLVERQSVSSPRQ